MFGKSKISKSMIDAVNSVIGEQPVVESKKPAMLSEKTEVTPETLKGQILKSKDDKKASLGKSAIAMSAEGVMEDGDCVTKPEAKDIAKKEVKGHEKKMHKEGMTFKERLLEKSTSEKQARTMAAAAHNPAFAKKVGIPQSVAKDFNQADKGTKQLSNAMKKEETEVQESLKDVAKKILHKVGGGSDKDQLKDLQRKMGLPQTGEKPKQEWKEEVEQMDEGGMPSSVIKNKQRNANMSDKDFANAHKDKSDADLKSMAWRHGYGKDSNHYVDRRNRGQQGVQEDVGSLHEDPHAAALVAGGLIGAGIHGAMQAADKAKMAYLYHGYGKSRMSVYDRLSGRRSARQGHEDKIEKHNNTLNTSKDPKEIEHAKSEIQKHQAELKKLTVRKALSMKEGAESVEENAFTDYKTDKKPSIFAAKSHTAKKTSTGTMYTKNWSKKDQEHKPDEKKVKNEAVDKEAEKHVRVDGETDMNTKTVDMLRGRVKVPADYHNKTKSYKVGLTVGEEVVNEAHPDEKEDKELIHKEVPKIVKKDALKKTDEAFKGPEAGSGVGDHPFVTSEAKPLKNARALAKATMGRLKNEMLGKLAN